MVLLCEKEQVVFPLIDRNAFNSLVGKLGDAKSVDKAVAEASDEPTRKVHDALKNCTFDDMEMLRPIGAGGFGIVKLVKVRKPFSYRI